MEDRIVICGRNIDADVTTVFNKKTLRDDKTLIENILEYSEKIKSNGGEIFKHNKIVILSLAKRPFLRKFRRLTL